MYIEKLYTSGMTDREFAIYIHWKFLKYVHTFFLALEPFVPGL